ncbi:hypothetical protein, partial [Parvimonas sp. D9]
MFDPLSSHSFPREDITDQEIVAALGLPRYLDTIDFKAPQKLAINFGLKTDRFVLSFDKGMGKTITYLTIMHLRGVPKLLIICGKNAMLAQRREILRHFPAWAASYTFIRGNRERRMRQWSEDKRVYITT